MIGGIGSTLEYYTEIVNKNIVCFLSGLGFYDWL